VSPDPTLDIWFGRYILVLESELADLVPFFQAQGFNAACIPERVTQGHAWRDRPTAEAHFLNSIRQGLIEAHTKGLKQSRRISRRAAWWAGWPRKGRKATAADQSLARANVPIVFVTTMDFDRTLDVGFRRYAVLLVRDREDRKRQNNPIL